MTCYHPVVLHQNRVSVILGPGAVRPCGQCIGCRLDRARSWALRCVHESQLHEQNSFITLTYRNENLPSDCSINQRALQLFFKRMRKYYGNESFRYYACGEYGDRFSRPHYHVCLFGIDFDDKEGIYKANYRWHKNHFQKGVFNDLYTSPSLEKIWGNGFVTVGELSLESAGYVARYCMKKITGKKAKSHYGNRVPEFALMSRKPGIGGKWFEKYSNDVYPKDFTTINGQRIKPPKYYDSLLEKLNPQMFKQLKEEREKRRLEKVTENEKRRYQQEKCKHTTCKTLKRRLDDA